MKERLQAWGDTRIIPIVSVFAFNEYGELLLLQRHTEDLGGGQWGTPGGRIEPGEEGADAVVRELYEESGISGVELVLLGAHLVHMPHGTVHMTSYKAVIPKETAILLDAEEHHAYAWFKVESLVKEADILWGVPSILRDFGILDNFSSDPTLADGSSVELLELAL